MVNYLGHADVVSIVGVDDAGSRFYAVGQHGFGNCAGEGVCGGDVEGRTRPLVEVRWSFLALLLYEILFRS